MDRVIIFYVSAILAKINEFQRLYMLANPGTDMTIFTKKFIRKLIDSLNDI